MTIVTRSFGISDSFDVELWGLVEHRKCLQAQSDDEGTYS